MCPHQLCAYVYVFILTKQIEVTYFDNWFIVTLLEHPNHPTQTFLAYNLVLFVVCIIIDCFYDIKYVLRCFSKSQKAPVIHYLSEGMGQFPSL